MLLAGIQSDDRRIWPTVTLDSRFRGNDNVSFYIERRPSL